MPPILTVSQLSAGRGERPLFSNVAFSLAPGAVLLLRGANGSGKSTLLRALLGMAASDSGRVRVNGEEFEARSGRLRASALYLGHACGMKGELPAAQALALAAHLDRSPTDPAHVTGALARLGLARRATLACWQLSQGQRQRLSLARLALASQARPARPLWLLDEPQTALDAEGLAVFEQLLAEHCRRNGCAIIATHSDIATTATTLAIAAFAPAPYQ